MLLRPLRETREHTSSYYAATAHPAPHHPALDGSCRADVCVIGGGFSGLSTALSLAERGYSVVLVEANRIGWGASGRNGGQLIGGFSMEPEAAAGQWGPQAAQAVFDMGCEAVDIVRERIERHAIDCDLVWGYADVATRPSHMERFRQQQQRFAERGYKHTLQLLSREQARERVVSDAYHGMLINPGYGHLHPLKLCLGEAAAAAGLGVRLFEQTRATRILRGPKPAVLTERGRVDADFVVVCGDAYLGHLVPELASRNLPAASFIIATEPLGQRVEQVMRQNLAICDTRWALDYFRLSADGRLLFGGACNYTGLAPANPTASMRAKMLKVFPQLADVRIDYTWGGQIGISMNRIPQLGRLTDTIYFAQGYSGHGVGPTHLMGRLLAEMIAGQAERFDLFARIRHRAFPGGSLLRQPLLALGMAYYQARDRFSA